MAGERVISHGVQRLLSKLETSVNAGDYYEAHQLYRSLYYRYLGLQRYGELLDMLYDGATLLLRNNEQSSGADLAILLVEVLIKSETPPSDEHFSKLSRLFSMINAHVPERETFLRSALRWSMRGSPEHKSGHPQFHQSIAQIFWREKNYILARYHFLHSTDGNGCGTMLVELHLQRGFTSEVDLFIAQAVLQYLCLRNKSTASVAFTSYTTQHPNIKKGPPYLLPLLNFIWFLLQAVDSGKHGVFTVLCQQYEPSIKRDPSYSEYLDKIGQIFFGAPSAKPKPRRFLGTFFRSLLTGLDDHEPDDETPSNSQAMETEDLD